MNESYIYRLFSLAVLDAFKNKNMPEWIKTHPSIKDRSNVKKVFPSVGIKNFEEKVDSSPEDNAQMIKPYIRTTMEAIYKALSFMVRNVNSFVLKKGPKLEESEFDKLLEIVSELGEMNKSFVLGTIDDNKSAQVQPNGTVKIVTTGQIVFNKKTIARPGESVFKVFEKIKNIFNDFSEKIGYILPIINLDAIPEFKEFSKNNIPINMTVVFSSEGEGAWDLATMSMRGISSCQSWEGEYKQCLIGSIASKYVGIIYLTSKSDYKGYGSKMIKRCIVRFGIDTKNKKPVIILDRMYDSYDPRIAKLFLDALKRKTMLPVYNFALNYSDTYGSSDEDEKEIANLPLTKNIQIPDENLVGVDKQDPYNTSGAMSYMDTQFKTKYKSPPKKDDINNKLSSIMFNIKDDTRSEIRNLKNYYDYSSDFLLQLNEITLLNTLFKIKKIAKDKKITNIRFLEKFYLKLILNLNKDNIIQYMSKWTRAREEIYSLAELDALCSPYIDIVKDIANKLLSDRN